MIDPWDLSLLPDALPAGVANADLPVRGMGSALLDGLLDDLALEGLVEGFGKQTVVLETPTAPVVRHINANLISGTTECFVVSNFF
jgi:hypothetical protein